MTPDEFPDWTVVDIGNDCSIIKKDGVWRWTDTDGAPYQEAVQLWYEQGDWEVVALPVGWQPTPLVRLEDPWELLEPHEFKRFAADADFRHVCAECRHPRRHPIHGLEFGLDREPKRFPTHLDPPNSSSVSGCYAALMDTLDEYNELVPEEDQVCVAPILEEVIAAYIEERGAIESIWNQRQEDESGGPDEL